MSSRSGDTPTVVTPTGRGKRTGWARAPKKNRQYRLPFSYHLEVSAAQIEREFLVWAVANLKRYITSS